MSAIPIKVLVIDDEPPIRKLLRMGLSTQGYEILEASNGKTALELLGQNPALIILDLGLPDIQGHELLRMIRGRDDGVPIVVLSSRGDEAGKVEALDLGAVDYLTKPFGMDELLARMRALLRRQAARKQTIYEHNGITLDLLAHVVKVGDRQLDLTAREYALMTIFVQNAGRVLTRSLIAEKIWDSHFDVDTNLIDVYMSRLRAKVGTAAGKPMFKTIRGIGYQLL